MKDNRGPVLITGGAGFIGSHLTEALLRAGRCVVAIDDLSTGLYSNVAAFDKDHNFRLYVETIRNERLMRQLLRRCPTVVTTPPYLKWAAAHRDLLINS